jgi:signal transduction histidine kinase
VDVRVDRLAADAAAIKGLELPATGEAIYVSVRDDGKGMPEQPSGGFGLLGIGERVRGMGGMLRISNPPSGGMIVEAAIPVESGRG